MVTTLPAWPSKRVPGVEQDRRGVQRGVIAVAPMALEPTGDMSDC